ncbi:hypothetical protein Micbo1qcDRAFT_49853 [Microdochium bolleyi]|uniref:Uncharacterized protein n=1 Tax=Microdochium bolleyi TaxID=196109 RepID=A0A136J6H5_9PEZI|nr:hypothetical protein Micbo1qcDRAFT_49853 [Microdochium bolleyi]
MCIYLFLCDLLQPGERSSSSVLATGEHSNLTTGSSSSAPWFYTGLSPSATCYGDFMSPALVIPAPNVAGTLCQRRHGLISLSIILIS